MDDLRRKGFDYDGVSAERRRSAAAALSDSDAEKPTSRLPAGL